MKDVSVSFATTAFIQAANIATGLLAARLLLPEGRGELAEILLWAGLVIELGILALPDALLYRAATAAASPQKLFASMATLLAGLSVLLIAAGAIVEYFIFTGSEQHLLMLALAFLVAYVPIYLGSLLMASMFQGHLDMITWNLLRITVAVGYLCFIGIAWLTGHATVEGFAAANLLGNLAALVLGLILLTRRGWVSWKPDGPTMRGLIVYGSKVHVGEILNTVRQRIDQALVALLLPNAELGIYVVALTVANGPLILAQTLSNLAFPKISQQSTVEGKLVVFGRYLRFTIISTAVVTLVLLVLNPILVPLLFGQPFAPAAIVANIMLLGLPAAAAKLMFMQALKAWDRSLVIGQAEIAGLIAAVIALVVLLPMFGTSGAAASLVVANVAAAGAMALSLKRSLGISVLTLFRPTASDWEMVTELMSRFRR
jgi:O-antigen/teichoic acid export membrane protein